MMCKKYCEESLAKMIKLSNLGIGEGNISGYKQKQLETDYNNTNMIILI